LYTHMIQMIYKELMLMGLVTFCVIMYEATPTGGISETEESWISAIDFSHVYLFFVTFFFVMHAFYLMFMSVWSSSSYRSMFTEKTSDLAIALEKVKSNWWDRFLFSVKELPLCSVRNRVEFSIIHSLFLKTYLIPENFDFPYYLSGCFDRFALRTINRSMFTWVVLLFIVACNYVRIAVGWSCNVPSEETDEERRLVEEEGGGHDRCKEESMYIFLGCGLALISYTLILTMITRVYKLRLVDRIYPDHNSIDDYLSLLRNKAKHGRKLRDPLASSRMSPEVLKKKLEEEFDEEEEAEEEDEEGIKFLAECLLSAYRWAKDTYSDTVVYINVKISECCSSKILERRKNPLGIFSSSSPSRNRSSSADPSATAEAGQHRASQSDFHRVTEEKRVHVPLKHRLTVSKSMPEAVSPERRPSIASDQEVAHREEMTIFNCCSNKEVEEDHDAEFKNIFIGGHPLWYFRAVELQIMFTCMYMALWATNFITIVKDTDDISASQEGFFQFLMTIPILVAFHRIAYIAETYSLILAISELNMEVLYEVLVNTEDMMKLADELRKKINAKIRSWSGVANPTEAQEREFLHILFEEIDQDGSGTIDKGEFRMMLRKLNLTYSDHRFNMLFRAVDSIGGDGSLEEEELVTFMFPDCSPDSDDEAEGDGGEGGDVIAAVGPSAGPSAPRYASKNALETDRGSNSGLQGHDRMNPLQL